ncbi:hypothetical protein LEP1GSC061_3901 [Leptospira wolffii serovar Khorat str. Khorat-H2]|nr:hypothetical protein LEP1GSC061_3901 [Leptospira wolffii serovar Khorat str. Khorat-H2]
MFFVFFVLELPARIGQEILNRIGDWKILGIFRICADNIKRSAAIWQAKDSNDIR